VPESLASKTYRVFSATAFSNCCSSRSTNPPVATFLSCTDPVQTRGRRRATMDAPAAPQATTAELSGAMDLPRRCPKCIAGGLWKLVENRQKCNREKHCFQRTADLRWGYLSTDA